MSCNHTESAEKTELTTNARQKCSEFGTRLEAKRGFVLFLGAWPDRRGAKETSCMCVRKCGGEDTMVVAAVSQLACSCRPRALAQNRIVRSHDDDGTRGGKGTRIIVIHIASRLAVDCRGTRLFAKGHDWTKCSSFHAGDASAYRNTSGKTRKSVLTPWLLWAPIGA